MEHYVTYHKILDLCEDFQIQSPILKSFGYGNLVDFGKNTSGTTTMYPFMFMVPQAITYDENTTTYQFSILFADILNTNLDNEKDCVSDMSLEARRFISFIKRGMNANPDLYNYMDIQMGVQAIPWQERFNDHCAGVALQANIIVFEDINACDYYPSPTPTPTVTTTATPTPTTTSTPTPTPTCPETTQYLEVVLQSCNSFQLKLWNSPAFSGVTTAQCDYSVSGTAYGDLGTVYTGTENILSGQHQHNFNLNAVLQPGECVSGFTVHSVTTIGCTCPVDVRICRTYQLTGTNFGGTFNYYDCDGVTQTFYILGTQTICALEDTVVLSSGNGTITEVGDCEII
jgi:hypothetical protein